MTLDSRDITYRFVSPQEWPQIKGQVMEIERPFYEGTPLAGNEEDYTDLFTHPRAITYAAEHNGKIVGFANCVPVEEVAEWYREDDGSPSDFFGEIGPNSSYFHSISVSAAYKRRGIGTELFEMALKDSKVRGYDTMSGYFSHETSKQMLDKTNPRISKPIENFGESGHTYEFGVTDIAAFEPKPAEPSKALVLYRK